MQPERVVAKPERELRKMIRHISLVLVLLAISACSNEKQGPTAFKSTQEALERVCTSPSSHNEIVRTIRALNWPLLGRGSIPEQVIGNGSVKWSQVAVSPGQDIMVAAGRLGGTSFCRVYVRYAEAAPVERDLAGTLVLGAPLGTPTYRQRIEGSDVTGWLRRAGGDWRAVHLSIVETGAAQEPPMTVVIEVTRSAV